jgi:hypothetical protein
MSSPEYPDEKRQIAYLPDWRAGFITIYDAAPRRGKKPQRIAFPCTRENQLIFQRLVEEQSSSRQTKRHKTLDAPRLPKDVRD